MTETIKEEQLVDLVDFYGTECHFCKKIEPFLQRLEEEENVKISRVEVWHNAENAKLWQKLDAGKCGGVPFLINRKTGKWICGYAYYEKLKEWALGK